MLLSKTPYSYSASPHPGVYRGYSMENELCIQLLFTRSITFVHGGKETTEFSDTAQGVDKNRPKHFSWCKIVYFIDLNISKSKITS